VRTYRFRVESFRAKSVSPAVTATILPTPLPMRRAFNWVSMLRGTASRLNLNVRQLSNLRLLLSPRLEHFNSTTLCAGKCRLTPSIATCLQSFSHSAGLSQLPMETVAKRYTSSARGGCNSLPQSCLACPTVACTSGSLCLYGDTPPGGIARDANRDSALVHA
jgi:hypothetical protein